MADTAMTPRVMHDGVMLHAGPVSLKFADGQLRNLRLGDREIIRRVYFAVREPNWDTDPPAFQSAVLDKSDDHFQIRLAASCRGKAASFDWRGTITGLPDGTIVYQVDGAAPADCKSNRIGLCVLYGAASVVGEEFLLADTGDGPTDGLFPLYVSPTLVAKNFKALQYKTADGTLVSCGISECPFEMEDQRNWGDSSFKAYNPMPFGYPDVKGGQRLTQTLRIGVQNVPAPAVAKVVELSLEAPIAKSRIPALGLADGNEQAMSFVELNPKLRQFENAGVVKWSWTTATHLADDDTQMENLPSIADQAETVRTTAKIADLEVGPIGMDPAGAKIARPVGFATAWTAGAIKWLALGGVARAAFVKSTPESAAVIDAFKPYSGRQLVGVKLSRNMPGLECFAAEASSGVTLWIVNKEAAAAEVWLPGGVKGEPQRLGAVGGAGGPVSVVRGKLSLDPYEVVQVEIGK